MRAVTTVAGTLLAAALSGFATGGASAQVAAERVTPGQRIETRIGDDAPRLGGIPFRSFRFDATAGERYLVVARSDAFPPYLRIGQNVSGITDYVLIGGDHGLGAGAAHLFAPGETGEYLIVVHGEEGGTGEFTLSVEPVRPASEPLAIGVAEVGALDLEAFHRFSGVAGQEVVITARSSELDVVLDIGTVDEYGDFVTIASDDDGAGGTDARLYFIPPSTGEYVLRVREYSAGGGGGYAILAAPPVPRPAPTPFLPDALVGGDLTDESPADDDGQPFAEWTLDVERDARYRIDLWSNDFDTRLAVGRLEGSRFIESASNDDASTSDLGPTDSRLVVRGDGRPVVLRVSGFSNDGRGAYSLRATRLPDALSAPTVATTAVGSTVQGEITDIDALLPSGHSYQEYRFSATAGQRIDVALSSDQFDAFLVIGLGTGPSMAELVSNDDGYGNPNSTDSRIVFTPPASGEYTIRVRTWEPGEIGRYTLSLAELPPPRADRRIDPDGPAVQELITDADERLPDGAPFHAWSFIAQSGEGFTIDLSSDDFDTVVSVGRVVNGEYLEIANNDDLGNGTDSRVTFTAAEAGEYTIRVMSFSGTGRGNYTLAVRRER